jgi:hypothetical protein
MSPYITTTNETELHQELKTLNDNLHDLPGVVSDGQLRAWRLRKQMIQRKLRTIKHEYEKLLSTTHRTNR